MHAEWVQKSAMAGKHILCEKSFAINLRETEIALKVVNESKVFCMEAQMFRCHPIISRLKLCVDEKPLGEIVSVDTKFTARIIHLFNRHGGGSILDLGCYPVSLLRYVFGEPTTVIESHATIEGPRINSNGIQENMFDTDSFVVYQMPGNITATVNASNDKDMLWEFVIRCERGTISLSNLWDASRPAILIQHLAGGTGQLEKSERMVLTSPKDFYTLQIDVANECIANGSFEATSPAMNWSDSLGNMRALDMWRQSIGLRYPMDDET